MKPRKPAPLDWGSVQFFLAVAESGTIAAAAKRLAVNHSTVLRRVAQLEGALRCRLFDRLPGGYALTASGNAFARNLAGLSDRVETVQRTLSGRDVSLAGTLRVTSSDIVVEGLLMPLLGELGRRHPRLAIQLVTSYEFSEQADVAVRGADRAPPGLVGRCIGQIETVMCASERYLKRAGVDTPLAEHRWVSLHESLSFPMFQTWMRKHVRPEKIAVRVDSLVAAADAVAAGLGLGLLPQPLVTARRELVQIGRPEPGLRKRVWVLMHPQLQNSARVGAAFTFLHEALEADDRLTHSEDDRAHG